MGLNLVHPQWLIEYLLKIESWIFYETMKIELKKGGLYIGNRHN